MFRASQFPSLSCPAFFLSNLRLPVLSSLDFSSFKSPPSSSFSKFPPFPRLRAPAASPFPSPFSRRPPSMVDKPRLRGKASFSAGSTGRENKELLVQHLLVGEDNLKLLLDLQQRISGASFSAGSTGRENKELLVQHLLVGEDNLKLLLDLQQRISGGDDLSDLAVEYSICPSKENGGMLGWVRRGQTVPEFEEAAFNAPLNKVVRCKTKFGWHLLQVLSEREESMLLDIEPEELHSKMQDPSFIEEAQLIDVREPEEVAQASLPGFKILPLRQFGTWGSVITDEFDPQKDTYVLGFKRVFNVSGGIHAYALKADPSIPTY